MQFLNAFASYIIFIRRNNYIFTVDSYLHIWFKTTLYRSQTKDNSISDEHASVMASKKRKPEVTKEVMVDNDLYEAQS